MPRWGRVLDASFSRVTQAEFVALKAQGFEGFIQCLQTGGFEGNEGIKAVAEANLRDAEAAGYLIAGYTNTSPWYIPTIIMQHTKANAGDMWQRLELVINDMEITGITEAQCRAMTEAIQAEGKRVAHYTANWFAQRYGMMQTWTWMNNLWDAKYDGVAQVARVDWGPMGATVVGKQFRGTTYLGGDAFDLNIFDLDFIKRQVEEDDMFDQDDNERLINVEADLRLVLSQMYGLYVKTDELAASVNSQIAGLNTAIAKLSTSQLKAADVITAVRSATPNLTPEEEQAIVAAFLEIVRGKPGYTPTAITRLFTALRKWLPGGN